MKYNEKWKNNLFTIALYVFAFSDIEMRLTKANKWLRAYDYTLRH